MLRLLFILLTCLVIVPEIHGQEVRFIMPLKGELGKDFFIDTYVDHDTSSGVRDAFCGNKTYNGHTGTDISLRSFKTMDIGVYVYAAADGRVYYTHDGEYDRSKQWKGGGLGNHVRIIHTNGLRTYYGHLMKYSLLVKEGDSVKAGQPIGKVGSSGNSKGPHVHFEVRDKDKKVIDPFAGNCQTENPSLWVSQPANDTGLYAIESGFTPYSRNADTLKERYLVRDTFYFGVDSVVCFWVMMHGLQPGKIIRTEWRTPGGFLYRSFSYVWKGEWWRDYARAYIKVPNKKGQWTVKLFVDDALMAAGQFHVMK